MLVSFLRPLLGCQYVNLVMQEVVLAVITFDESITELPHMSFTGLLIDHVAFDAVMSPVSLSVSPHDFPVHVHNLVAQGEVDVDGA